MTDIDKLQEVLFKTAVEEDDHEDNCDIYTALDLQQDNPDFTSSDHSIRHDYEFEFEYEDNEYEDWLNETYSADDLCSTISTMEDDLADCKSIFDDGDCRYYPEEHSNLEEALDRAVEAIRELKNRAEQYSTY